MSDIVSSSREIGAPAQAIFDLLADPSRHREIDGSGTVRAARDGVPARLSLGAEFAMSMKAGAGYTTKNVVSEFEEGRRIAWHHGLGNEWRYILQPLDDTRTVVTEQWDPTHVRLTLILKLMNARKRSLVAIEGTLDRLAEWAENRAR